MKKIKNTELKQNNTSLKCVKDGKIQKEKQKTAKKFKDTVDFKLAPKQTDSNFKKNRNDGDITKKNKEFKNEAKSHLQKVAIGNVSELQGRQNESKGMKNELQNKIPNEEKTEAELKKIEKKKAKKLAQKLKKRQKKAQNKDFVKIASPALNSEQKGEMSLGQKVKNVKNNVNEDHNKKHSPLVNGKQNPRKLETAGSESRHATFGEALTKKQKKAMRRRLIEDQKLESADNKNIDATGSEALTKKAKKALKKKMIKDKKLETAESKSFDGTSSGVPSEKNTLEDQLTKDKKLETTDNKSLEATSNNVLTKKERKALKRQLIKDQILNEKKTRDPAIEAATVFVGNLPVNVKRVQLDRLFKKFGPVNSIRLRSAGGKVLYKHKERKLAGSLNAYVVLQSKEKAEKALSLNGSEFKGNHLRVTLTTKNPETQHNGEAKRTVFVGNLKYSASEESLREIFSSCGEIEYVRCIREGDKGCKGVAYVCFKTADAVGLALELNETIVDERPIHVERYNVKKLGAKKAREDQTEKEGKSKMGAKLRIDGKKDKNKKSGHKLVPRGETDDTKKSKKSEFRGVKVEGLKKKQKSKKKKSNDQMLQLAKKIAPKPKN